MDKRIDNVDFSQAVGQPLMGVGATVQEKRVTNLTQEQIARINASEVKEDTSFPELHYLLKKKGVEFLSKGDIAFIKGKQKQGKTMALKVIVAALLGDNIFGFQSLKDDIKICYIDTEQNARDTQRFLTAVKEMVPGVGAI